MPLDAVEDGEADERYEIDVVLEETEQRRGLGGCLRFTASFDRRLARRQFREQMDEDVGDRHAAERRLPFAARRHIEEPQLSAKQVDDGEDSRGDQRSELHGFHRDALPGGTEAGTSLSVAGRGRRERRSSGRHRTAAAPPAVRHRLARPGDENSRPVSWQ